VTLAAPKVISHEESEISREIIAEQERIDPTGILCNSYFSACSWGK